METVVRDRNGNRLSTSSIVRRSDVTYDGLNFYVRFDF
jgi:hypothetical protein